MPRASGNTALRFRSVLSSERVAHLIKHAFRRTSRALSRRLNAHDVSYGHWTLLRVLWQSDGLTQRELSDKAGVTEPSTFVAVHAMERLGYIRREKLPDNHKEVRVFLTGRGAALRDVSVSAAEEVNRVALAGISADHVAITRRTLLAMIDNLDRDETRARRARPRP